MTWVAIEILATFCGACLLSCLAYRVWRPKALSIATMAGFLAGSLIADSLLTFRADISGFDSCWRLPLAAIRRFLVPHSVVDWLPWTAGILTVVELALGRAAGGDRQRWRNVSYALALFAMLLLTYRNSAFINPGDVQKSTMLLTSGGLICFLAMWACAASTVPLNHSSAVWIYCGRLVIETSMALTILLSGSLRLGMFAVAVVGAGCGLPGGRQVNRSHDAPFRYRPVSTGLLAVLLVDSALLAGLSIWKAGVLMLAAAIHGQGQSPPGTTIPKASRYWVPLGAAAAVAGFAVIRFFREFSGF